MIPVQVTIVLLYFHRWNNCDYLNIPVLFALLSNKNQRSYRRLIEKFLEICPLFNPKSVMMNFERATINAFNDIFTTKNPSFTMFGCFFSLTE
jgi:hypothetical protein